LGYNPRDHYFKKAKKENFAARSVFKLEEIDERLRIFRAGQLVLDLGAAPGSWSQYASKKVGASGRVLGIDLQPISIRLPNAAFFQADLKESNAIELFEKAFGVAEARFDVVLSDMAPKTTGIRLTDQARSLELCELALQTALQYLKTNGSFVCKLFHSDEFKDFQNRMKQSFDKVDVIKPKATRQISKEIFLIGLRKLA